MDREQVGQRWRALCATRLLIRWRIAFQSSPCHRCQALERFEPGVPAGFPLKAVGVIMVMIVLGIVGFIVTKTRRP